MNIALFIPMVLFAIIGWIATTGIIHATQLKKLKAVAALHGRVLDRCASGADTIAYLESRVTREFFRNATAEPNNPAVRILSAVQRGSVLLCIGIAEFAIRREGFRLEADHVLLVTGALAMATGMGFLIAACVSYMLSQSWGLLTDVERPRI